MNLRLTGVPALPVVIYVVKNASRPKPVTFSPAQGGKRFAFQVDWIITLRAGLCKYFLQKKQLKIYKTIDKEMKRWRKVYFASFCVLL